MAAQNGPDKNAGNTTDQQQPDNMPKQDTTRQEYDQLLEQTDAERTKKPGSQSNSSGQHNNGRGGGK